MRLPTRTLKGRPLTPIEQKALRLYFIEELSAGGVAAACDRSHTWVQLVIRRVGLRLRSRRAAWAITLRDRSPFTPETAEMVSFSARKPRNRKDARNAGRDTDR